MSNGAEDASGGAMTEKQLRIGMVASDTLRIVGLQALLEESMEIISLTAPGTMKAQGLAMIVLDEHSTDQIFTLIAAFKRALPLLPVLVMGESREQDYIMRIIATGARGYLAETARVEEIRMAIDVVRDGSVWAPRKVLARLIDAPPERSREPEPVLTPRETEVLELLMAGRSNREIAASLSINPKTVKVHVGHLLAKTGVTNRVALTVRTLRTRSRQVPNEEGYPE